LSLKGVVADIRLDVAVDGVDSLIDALRSTLDRATLLLLRRRRQCR
jgi:hypothetical protein